MRTELIEAAEVTAADIDRWRDLATQALEPNPFHEPEYVLPLARGLGQLAELRILVARDATTWHACMPVRVGRWHRIPAPAIATWQGHALYSLLGTPLVSRSHPHAAMAALLSGLLGSHRVAFAALAWIAEDGPAAAVLGDLLAERPESALIYERFDRAAIRRRPEDDYLVDTLSPKHRRELRRQRRKLTELLGEEPTMVDRAGEEGAPEGFVALEAAGKKNTVGSPLAADARHETFFYEMCRAFAAQGRLQMLSLEAGGETLASKCNIVAGNTIFCLKIAFDERWAKHSPGIQLEVEMIKFFHERSIAEVMDSCAYTGNPMINRLWPDRREISTYMVPSSGLLGGGTVAMTAAARSLRDRLRERGRN